MGRLARPLLAGVTFVLFSISCLAWSEDLLVYGTGIYDFNALRSSRDAALDLRLEIRREEPLFSFGPSGVPYRVKPFWGLEWTSDGALYGLGGLYLERVIGENFLLTPSFGGGLYSKGDGKDLGYGLEFRSALEISRKLFGGSYRIGLSLSHISNANLGSENPGAEVLSLSLQGFF